jgi:hypothetical protein
MSITNGALYDRFDLEESITQLGNIVDDLQILSDNVMENEECTTDDIVNILTGTITVQQFRMNKAIEILEYLIETKILDNSNHEFGESSTSNYSDLYKKQLEHYEIGGEEF